MTIRRDAPEPGNSASRRTSRLAALTGGILLFALCVALMPVADVRVSRVTALLSFVPVLVSLGVLLSGLLRAVAAVRTPRLLVFGAVCAGLSVPAALAAPPEVLNDGPTPLALVALVAADLLRVFAAASVGVSLARQVSSAGVALLIAGVATAADLFSVFAGPTKALIEGGSPALDFLLLIFPLLGTAYGFGLGVSDFVFLALFAALASYLSLRPTLTLLATTSAIVLALAAGLILVRPLPALPFLSIAFLLTNADLLLGALRKRPSRH